MNWTNDLDGSVDLRRYGPALQILERGALRLSYRNLRVQTQRSTCFPFWAQLHQIPNMCVFRSVSRSVEGVERNYMIARTSGENTLAMMKNTTTLSNFPRISLYTSPWV